MGYPKKSWVYKCQNPNCYTHHPKRDWSYTLSTAMNEEEFCSLACEKEVTGGNFKNGTLAE